MTRQHLEHACEEIDAEIFSGDVLYDTSTDKDRLLHYIKRWLRAFAEQPTAPTAHEYEIFKKWASQSCPFLDLTFCDDQHPTLGFYSTRTQLDFNMWLAGFRNTTE